MNLISKIFSSKSLLFVYIVPAFTDWLFTVLGQPDDYWIDFKVINEINPFANFMLSIHPAFFVLGTLIFYFIFALIIERLKEPLNLAFAFFLMTAHSWGLSSWTFLILRKYGIYDPYSSFSASIAWTIQVAYFILIGFIAAIAIRRYMFDRNR